MPWWCERGRLVRGGPISIMLWVGVDADVRICRIYLRSPELDEWCRCGPFRDAPFCVSWTEPADDISV